LVHLALVRARAAPCSWWCVVERETAH
jgi:hypothetical protein